MREPRGVECTAEALQAAGRAVARAAARARISWRRWWPRPTSRRAAAEAVLARIEISAALGADRLGAEVLEHTAAFEPLPSHRIAGGNQRLAEAMAERLGDRVRLGVEVRSLDELDARHVILAVPLPALSRWSCPTGSAPRSSRRRWVMPPSSTSRSPGPRPRAR